MVRRVEQERKSVTEVRGGEREVMDNRGILETDDGVPPPTDRWKLPPNNGSISIY